MATQDYVDSLVTGNINQLTTVAQQAVADTNAQVEALIDIIGNVRPPLLFSNPLPLPNFSGVGTPPSGSVDTTAAISMISKYVPLFALPPAPPNTFKYAELDYNDTLLSAVQNKILNIVDKGWSSSQSENLIWNRLYERLAQAANDAIDLKLSTWASRGWTLPSGMANAQLGTIITERLNAMLDASRDIMIKQADLTDQNDNRYTEHALAFEAMMLLHFENVANRAVLVKRTALEMSIQLYNATVTAWSAGIRIPEMLIDALRLNVEIYSADVRKYDITANVVIAKSKITLDTAMGNLNVSIENFKSDLSAFIELSRAKIQGTEAAANTLASMANAALGALHSVVQLEAQSVFSGT